MLDHLLEWITFTLLGSALGCLIMAVYLDNALPLHGLVVCGVLGIGAAWVRLYLAWRRWP